MVSSLCCCEAWGFRVQDAAMRKIFVPLPTIGSFVLLAAFSMGSVAQAESTPETICAVPVCDIAAYLTALREAPNAQREQKILKDFPTFLQDNRKTTDLAVWQNLAELGEKVQELSIQLGDPDYILREAANMIDVSMLGLFRFGPTTSENLFEAFSKISSSGRRYEALSFWDKLEREQSLEVVEVVVDFAIKAEALARKIDDPEWIIAKARQLATTGSTRIAALDPIVEGQYKIRLLKDPNFAELCGDMDSVDTLIVANWMTSEGLVATLMSRRLGMHKAYFKNLLVSEGATRIRGQALSQGTSSRITLKLDKDTGDIRGSFSSTRTGCTYRLEGTRKHSPGLYLRDGALELPEKPTLKSVTGIYQAVLVPDSVEGSKPKMLEGRFIIRSHEQPNGSVLAASFVRKDFTQDFQYGYLVSPRGFMVFNSGSGEQTLVRWDMAFRPDDQGVWAWRGQMFSLFNGVTGQVVLKKVSELGSDDEE